MERQGHQVTWWTSRFDHHRKVLRDEDAARGTGSRVHIEFLQGDPYPSNVSLARMRHNRQTAADFRRRAAAAAAPDVILCSYPTVELSDAAVVYGQRNGVPVILDIRDLWPDIFLNLVPRLAQPLARLALHGMFRASRRACAGATAILGITDSFVQWGVERARRARGPFDQAFPLAYRAAPPKAEELNEARRSWDAMGLREGVPILCFFGTFGRQFDIPAVLRAARLTRDLEVRFVLCGAGDRLDEYRRAAADLPHVLFPGWVSAASIWALMERSAGALAPYHCEESFTMSIPNKAIEYLAGGLPMLSSLRGELAALLEREKCGRTWPEGDHVALAEAIRMLLRDPARRLQMSDNARRVYEATFIAEDVYGRLIDHVARIAGANRSARSPVSTS